MARINLTPILPVWLLLLALGVSLSAVILQHRALRSRIGLKKAAILSLLRLAVWCMVILFALNASVTSSTQHRLSPAIAIIVDRSASMGLPGKQTDFTRLDEAKRILENSLLPSLSQNYDVRLYALGNPLRELSKGELSTLAAEGKGGNIDDALKQLSGKASIAILLSDGAAETDQSSQVSSEGLVHGPPAKNLPVLTMAMGNADAYRDLLISAVKAPAVAFSGREVTIDAIVKNRGYTNVTIPVLLKDGARLVKAKSIHFTKSGEDLPVSFSFTPGETGIHAMSVSTPVQVGESIQSNNIANLSIKVMRDKTRILYVAGNPSPNYRFLRMALKNDPSVDLLSFVILRTPSNVINVPLQEQSLIPFPVDTLFSEELKSFDLLIFDNLSIHVYLNQKHLETIRNFVASGGAFALIGGPNMADGGRISGTPLSEILPVGFPQEQDYSRNTASRVRLTSAGATHPITELSGDKMHTLRLWNEMPPLDGLNRLKAKGSSVVLIESAASPARPVLTIGSYGKGRVMTLATDFSWKWGTGMVAQGGDNSAYLRFVERSVRWLTQDPSLNPVTMVLPDKSEEGQDAEIRIRAKEEQTILFSVFSPQGMKLPSQLKTSGAPGEYIGSFRTEKKGTYRIRLQARSGSLEEFLIVGDRMQTLDAAPNHELLRSLSAATGGKVLDSGHDPLKEIGSYMEDVRKSYVEEREVPLWSLPWVLALVVAFLAAEWFLRRRWGLV